MAQTRWLFLAFYDASRAALPRMGPVQCSHWNSRDSEKPCPVGFLLSQLFPQHQESSSPYVMELLIPSNSLETLFGKEHFQTTKKSRIVTNSLLKLTSDPLPSEQSVCNFSSSWVPPAARKQHLHSPLISFHLSYPLFSCCLQEESFLTGI